MIYLGIDGGGSKTKFLLIDKDLNELCRFQTGPSNWISVGRDAAEAAIRDGISRLTLKPDVVCGGFAGSGRTEGTTFYKSVLSALLPLSTVIIESDAFVASIGALGIEPGVLLIAGTGSMAIGRAIDGSMFRVGGWGPHFGDEGSGFWVGREAVRAGLRLVDCQGPQEFPEIVARNLKLGSITDVVCAWAHGQIGVPDIAGLFPHVAALYPADPARQILTEAASHLRSLVETASQRVGVRNCRKSLSGSVANHPVIRELINLTFEEPRHSPEWGAAIWAHQQVVHPA